MILVNEYTASASEIVAGAMQDHDRAMIVGQTSFGKGLVQSIIPLPESTGLTLTSAKYFTPSGRLIQRDYSNGGWYNYIYRGGTLREDGTKQPAGPDCVREDKHGAVVVGMGTEVAQRPYVGQEDTAEAGPYAKVRIFFNGQAIVINKPERQRHQIGNDRRRDSKNQKKPHAR